jgi:chromosomal replication initiation ATPase DnaA
VTDDANVWNQLLDRLRTEVDPEEFRRWFSPTSYASDSGDLVTVWVPTEASRRHITSHYGPRIDRLLASIRPHSSVRLVVAGTGEDEEDE